MRKAVQLGVSTACTWVPTPDRRGTSLETTAADAVHAPAAWGCHALELVRSSSTAPIAARPFARPERVFVFVIELIVEVVVVVEVFRFLVIQIVLVQIIVEVLVEVFVLFEVLELLVDVVATSATSCLQW